MSKYQGKVDPLELLRGVYCDSKKAKIKDKFVVF